METVQVSHICSLLAEILCQLCPRFPHQFFGNSWELYSHTYFLCLLWSDITKLWWHWLLSHWLFLCGQENSCLRTTWASSSSHLTCLLLSCVKEVQAELFIPAWKTIGNLCLAVIGIFSEFVHFSSQETEYLSAFWNFAYKKPLLLSTIFLMTASGASVIFPVYYLPFFQLNIYIILTSLSQISEEILA